MAALTGLAILVPESRELDLFASMLEVEGASTLRCPLVQIADLEDALEAENWIARRDVQAWVGRFWQAPQIADKPLERLQTFGIEAAKLMRTTVFDLPKPFWIVEERPPHGDEIKLASLQTLEQCFERLCPRRFTLE